MILLSPNRHMSTKAHTKGMFVLVYVCMYVCMYASMRLLNCSINLSIKDQEKA